MENENLSPDKQNENITISKKTFYIISAALALIIIAVATIFFIRNKRAPEINKNAADSVSVKKDSASIVKDSMKNTEEYEEGEESPYSEYSVISKSITLPEGKLNFGDKVYVDESKSNETTKVVYLKNPVSDPNAEGYSMNASAFINSYSFDEYKKNFSLSPFSDLPSGVKKLILEKNYDDGNRYYVTQNAERAKSSVAFGDFDEDGLKDVAIIMDNNEKQISRLLIICYNKETKQPYVAFAESYSDKMKVRGFKKNASIYMNSPEFIKSPQDGIIVTGEDVVLGIVYDADLQKFKSYYQSPSTEGVEE